ncbi:carbon-nitrogen hydrolase family protein [bacterium]|nr:carbon-nitrogen hydrolase family protein [candidate division CSSED10-310 bacterium]
MKKLKIAAASIANYIGDYEKSIDSIQKWTQKAKAKDADVILFPELNLTGYITAPIAADIALPLDNRYNEMIVDICKDNSIVICYGFIEKEDQNLFCTHAIVDKDGIVGTQRKIHVPRQEADYWKPGNNIQVFDVNGTKIGLSICRDSFFPEYQRTLYFKGCEVVLMPFSYYNVPRSKYLTETHHGRSIQVNAWNNGFYAVVCNSAKNREPSKWEPNGRRFGGWCGIFDPWGEKIVFTDDEGNNETMIVAELDPSTLVDRRTHCNFLAEELRNGVYQFKK